MATTDALLAAEEAGAQVVIPHETLYLRPNGDSTVEFIADQPWAERPVNQRRREIIERANLTVVRFHGTVDVICVFDVFAELLGLDDVAAGEGCARILRIPPTPFRDLIERVKKAVGMEHVRVACRDEDMHKLVERVGLPWGGMGLGVNMGYQAGLIKKGCDAFISGEMDAGAFIHACEGGVPCIETSHEASEIPGIVRFTEILRKEHPNIRFDHFDNGICWRWG